MSRVTCFRPAALLLIVACVGTIGGRQDAWGRPQDQPTALKEVASFKAPNQLRYLSSAQFTPDGKTLVTTSDYGPAWDLKFTDVPSGKEKVRKAGQDKGFRGSYAMAPDGKLYVPFDRGDEHLIQVWDLDKDEVVKTYKVPARTATIKLSPNGEVLVWFPVSGSGVTSDGAFSVIDTRSGKTRVTLEGVMTVAFSPNGRLLAYGTWDDHAVKIYDLAAGKETHVLEGHKSAVRILFFRDDRTLISSTGMLVLVGEKEDRSVRVWDAETGKANAVVECPQEADNVALSPDGRTLVTTHKDKTARFWDVESGKETASFTPMENERVWHLAFMPDGKTMITTHYHKGIILWDFSSRTKKGALTALDDYCLQPVFTRDGKLMALPHSGGTIKLYEVKP